MPTYKAPTRDMRFVLHELLSISSYSELPGFGDATPEIIDAILEETSKLAQEVLQPLNQSGDAEGCVLENGVVRTPAGFQEAYQAFVDGGWPSLSADPAYGGQGLPAIIQVAFNEMVSAANMAFAMYPGLTRGAYHALVAHGTEVQKQTYGPNLVSGVWAGTMNLTEPHCGTDLGMLRTKAVPQADGSYQITGTKIFISAGEHDLTENIIHLVLARIEGAPEGSSGISLFIVPKFLVNDDGSLGARNGVACGALEEKMGIHANSTCVMNYDEATGFLIGEENKGLRAMFTMMNEARIGVGMQGFGQSEVAYQNAAEYARERLQGRALNGPANADGPADPIIVHADVRRMLMEQKAFNEGARAFIYWTALQADFAHRSADEEESTRADDMLALLTPVVKGYLTDKGFANAVQAQQIYGGHGYIRENGMDQFVRDARIAMIYEGANGVQALDLVGRKLPANGGRAVMSFFAAIHDTLKDMEGKEALVPFAEGLKQACDDLEKAVGWLMEHGLKDPDNAAAGSMDLMHLIGLVALALMWARMAIVAQSAIDGGSDDRFYADKITTGKFFVARMLPDTGVHLARICSGAEPLMALDAEAF